MTQLPRCPNGSRAFLAFMYYSPAITETIGWHMDELSYKKRAYAEDIAIGGASLEDIMPSRFPETGATQTQSTDYRLLDAMFEAVPLRANDRLLDVGCGMGRVLSYLHLRGFGGHLIGVELDPDIAAFTKSRFEGIDNVEVLEGNIFEQPELVARATSVFMFNPFEGNATLDFIELIEKHVHHPLRVYYCADYYHAFFEGRPRWELLVRENVERAGLDPLSYSIYEFAQS